MASRLELGSIVDDVVVDALTVTVRFSKCPAGWQAAFELSHPAVHDVSVLHRLVAPTLAEARASVPQAVTYLLGAPLDEPLYDDVSHDESAYAGPSHEGERAPSR